MTTLDQSDLSALLDALRAGDGVDFIRDLIRLVLQELVEAEAAGAVGAGRYERSEGRLTERNGHRSKTVCHQGRRPRGEDPQAQEGELLPLLPPAPPAHRPLSGWWPVDDDVVLFNPSAVAVTRYRYRANRIPTPWATHTEKDVA